MSGGIGVLAINVSGTSVHHYALSATLIQLLNFLVPLVHVILSYVLIPNLPLAILNRLFTLVFTISTGYRNLNAETVYGELAGIMLSIFAAATLKRFLTTNIPSKSIYDSFKKFKEGCIARERAMLGKGRIALMLLFCAVSALAIFNISIYTGLIFRLEPYVILTNYLITPLITLFIGMSIAKSATSKASCIALGVASGLGVVGIVPLISIVVAEWSSHLTYASRVIYTYRRGLYMGNAEAILTYGYPRAVYRGVSSRTPLNKSKEKWYWREVRHPLYVDLNELNTQHVVIVGSSGSGKTSLAKHIVVEASKLYGYNVVIIDQHGEYWDVSRFIGCRVIDASKCSLNPLVLGNVSPRERALQLAHVISTIFKLGFLQRRMLEEVIMKTYDLKGVRQDDPSSWTLEPPSLGDLVETCKSIGKEIPEFNRLLPYLILLHEHLSGGVWLSIEETLLGNSVIDMSKISSDFARALFIDTLMYMLINKMYSLSSSKKIMFVLEEARGVLPRSLTRELLSRLFTESRKFGFSIVVISQEIKRVPKVLIDNAGLRIFFVLNEPRGLEEASRIVGGAESREKLMVIQEALRTLPQHTFLMHTTGVDFVFIAKSPIMHRGTL